MLKLTWIPVVLAAGLALAAPSRGQPAPDQAGQQETRFSVQPGDVIVSRPGADETLALVACVEIAWQHNDQLRAEHQRLREMDGKVNQALSTGMPSLDVIGEWTRGRDPTFALDESFGGGGDVPAIIDSLFGGGGFLPAPEAIPAQTYWRASVNRNWTLNPIQLIGAVGAANMGIERQNLVIMEVEQRIAEETITAYYDIILAAEQLESIEAEIANQREFLDIAQVKYEVGMATVQDTLQAAVRVANLIPQRRRNRQELANAGSRLNALMGRDPKHPLSIHHQTPIETDSIDRARALELALRRPDVIQVELFVDILHRNRQAQKAEMRPYLTMNGAYGRVARQLDNLGNRGHDFWRAAVALNIPLFDGMLTRGLVQQTDANILVTESELSGMRRDVGVEILNLLDSLDTARKNLEATRLNLVRSEDLLEQMTMMFRLGKTDYLSTLVAEANRSDARSNLIEAAYEVLTLTASLKRAVGQSPLLPLAAIPGLVQEENASGGGE